MDYRAPPLFVKICRHGQYPRCASRHASFWWTMSVVILDFISILLHYIVNSHVDCCGSCIFLGRKFWGIQWNLNTRFWKALLEVINVRNSCVNKLMNSCRINECSKIKSFSDKTNSNHLLLIDFWSSCVSAHFLASIHHQWENQTQSFYWTQHLSLTNPNLKIKQKKCKLSVKVNSKLNSKIFLLVLA